MQPTRIPGPPGTRRNYTHDLPPPPQPAAKVAAEKRRARKQRAKSVKRWEEYLKNEKRNISHWENLIEKDGCGRAWDWGADWLACIAEYIVEMRSGWSERCEMEQQKKTTGEAHEEASRVK